MTLHPAMTYEHLMREAIALAEQACAIGEVPIGCVVFDQIAGQIIGRGFNRREIDHDPTAHAEVLALRDAARQRGHWRLTGCTIAVTLEPCPMCAGAIVNARVPRLVYGADDPKAGAVKTLYTICQDSRLNHRTDVTGGVLAAPCAALLKDFFLRQRRLGKK